jgi:hypothetical protein
MKRLRYEPREALKAFHNRSQRYARLVTHRRFGKTVIAARLAGWDEFRLHRADGQAGEVGCVDVFQIVGHGNNSYVFDCQKNFNY